MKSTLVNRGLSTVSQDLYYSGIDLRFYVHYVGTFEFFFKFRLGTLCTYSLIVYSELIAFPCIKLICLIYVL
jgi:hypothetical protein